MNENKVINNFPINDVCRVCLNNTKHLSPMSNDHIKLYISLIDEIVCIENNMKSCMMCKWLLQKFSKFKHQCRTANRLLKEVTLMDPKSLLLQSNLTNNHHMMQTSPAIHNYTPSIDNTFNDTHISVHTHYTLHNGTHSYNNTIYTQTYNKDTDGSHIDYEQDYVTFDNNDHSIENDKYTLVDHDHSIENDKYTLVDHDHSIENDKYTLVDHDHSTQNDKYSNKNDITNDVNNGEDEDELPLTLISKKSKGRTKKKSKKKKGTIEGIELANMEETAVKQETEVREDEEKSKRSNKVLRDGFSSRMVQETNEYVVIKLTREQVLQEMSERSKTEAYMSSPYKCDKCVKGFNFQDVLDTHMEKHSVKNGTFACDMCGQYCPSAVSLRGHVKSHTTRYKCKVCGAVRAARQHLVEHHAGHAGAAPAYQCLHCTFTTNKRTVMQRHARGHAPRESHACHKCGKLFKTIDYLRLHTARHDKSSRFKCDLCPDTFLYHSLLRKHVQCVHERKEYYCVECDVHFKCAESLRVHFKRAKRHRDPSALKHACGACPARFFTAGSLATHLSSTHDACKQHACHHCHRTYSTRDAVRAHTWRVHARGDARAACPHCHSSFARASVLRAHLRAQRGACAARGEGGEGAPVGAPARDKHEKEELPQYENKIEV